MTTPSSFRARRCITLLCEILGGWERESWDFTSFFGRLLRPREEDRLAKELSTMHLTVQFGLFWCFGSGHYLTPACPRNGDLKVENSWHRRRFIWQLIHFRLRKWRLDRLERLHNLPTWLVQNSYNVWTWVFFSKTIQHKPIIRQVWFNRLLSN